jgi:glyoxylase-like metal-dependent hydrolase (beta-lactamase superfamily II)
MHRSRILIAAVAVALAGTAGVVRSQAQKPLTIYSIDVEGGQATLFVSPSGESMLVDAGLPGARDADRIAEAAKSAGLTQIDYMVVTHYDADHVGGVKDVGERIPIKAFVDHGPRIPGEAFGAPQRGAAPTGGAGATASTPAAAAGGGGTPRGGGRGSAFSSERIDAAYAEARAKGRHIEVKVGDKVPIKGFDVQIVTGQGDVLKKPLPGAGAPNPFCQSYTPKEVDKTENVRSVGMVISYGRFRMLDLGDLTWTKEHDLVCPNNLVGTVDLYLTTHHGLAISGPPAIVHALHPRVALMNNGPRKGGSRETWTTLKSAPGLEDIWQLHYSVPRQPNPSFHESVETGGPEFNAPENFIANLDEAAAHAPAHAIKVAAHQDGSFAVTNLRNGFSKDYKAKAP